MIIPKNILIVRTDRIGDVVLSLPLAGIIKSHFPECRITYLVRNYTNEIVKDHPHIDDVIILDEVNGKIPIFKNVKNIKGKSFDTSIVVYPTFVTALIVFLSHIAIRVGSGYRWYSFLFNKRVFEHRKYSEKHELEYNVNLLKAFGIEEKVTPANVMFNLQVNGESLQHVTEILLKSGVDTNKKIIIIHPGSGGSSIDLSTEKFKELTIRLNQLNNIQILVTGGEEEMAACKYITESTKAINLAGKMNLSELVATIGLTDVFIANSTGPIHIASAFSKKVIGFYPKIVTSSQKRWGPYTTNKVVFNPEIECSNCTREQCERLNCMNSINIDNVISEVEKFII